jgi:hypothetical protein
MRHSDILRNQYRPKQIYGVLLILCTFNVMNAENGILRALILKIKKPS